MINADIKYSKMLDSPVRNIGVKVEHYVGSTLTNTFKHTDAVKSLTVDREQEGSKFFGFDICQKLNLKLIDKDAVIAVKAGDMLNVAWEVEGTYINTLPKFYISEVRRDENTNELSITAYDLLYEMTIHKSDELALILPYSIRDVANAIADRFGLTASIVNVTDESFNTMFPNGANLEGTEDIRSVVSDVAEATQTISYINANDELVFKRLDKDGEPIFNIDKNRYFTLQSGDNRRLKGICSATELGENIIAEIEASGTIQYVRDNPFWDINPDVAILVENAVAAMGGFTINQFSATWRGNFLLELGDKISLTTKENKLVNSFLLSDTITYDGSLEQKSDWKFEEVLGESADNPSNLGDALKQTFAKVDKVNKQIDLVVSDVKDNSEAISNMQITTDKISGSVSSLEKKTTEAINGVNSDIAVLNKRVDATITDEQVKIEIQNELSKGVNKVKTDTGFTFDEVGLTISKGNTDISTTITENGMNIHKGNDTVLLVNNEGVDAVNLHASTYLIVGKNSRFEDFNDTRTGCFWIGM